MKSGKVVIRHTAATGLKIGCARVSNQAKTSLLSETPSPHLLAPERIYVDHA